MRHVRAIVASVLLGSVVGAQNVGDFYVLDTQQQAILFAVRGGPVATLFTPSPNDATAMTNGPGDGSAYIWTNTPTAVPRPSVLRVDASTVSLVSSVASPFTLVPDIALDDAGDLLVLNVGGTRAGIHRMPLGPQPTSTLVTAFTPQSLPLAMGEDVETGDHWVLDSLGVIHRLDLAGGAVLSIAKTGATITGGGATVDPVSGDPLFAVGNGVLRYDPGQQLWTTVLSLGFPQGGSEALAITVDPLTRDFLFAGWQGFGPGMFGSVQEIDINGQPTRSTALGRASRPLRVVSAWGRAFTPAGPPTAGTTYRLSLQSVGDIGRSYQVGLSFGSRPGIPTPLGTIPLRVDPLLTLSLAGGPWFSGFAGTIGATGTAAVGIALPPGTRGVRLIAAAVTYDAQGLRSILGPHGFTIR